MILSCSIYAFARHDFTVARKEDSFIFIIPFLVHVDDNLVHKNGEAVQFMLAQKKFNLHLFECSLFADFVCSFVKRCDFCSSKEGGVQISFSLVDIL